MKILLFNFNGVLTAVAEELKKQGHTVKVLTMKAEVSDWKQYDRIVVWNETDIAGFRGFIKMAQQAGKKVILVQHGRRGTSRIYPPFNEELISDVICAWGENDRKRLMSVGVPESKIRVTGTPIFRYIKPRIAHDGVNVVFSPEHWGTEVAENAIVASQLRKLKNVHIVTKVLKGEHENIYDNAIMSDRNSADHFDIIDRVLATADVVVGISESTFELLAEYLDIPVVIADIWQPKAGANGDERYKEYHREYSNACIREKDPFKIAEAVKMALKKPAYLKKERASIAITDGGTDIKDPVQEIIKVITE